MTFVQSGARVAVTGATGFVGRVLVQHLNRAGYRVVGISESEEAPFEMREALTEYVAADLARGWPNIGKVDGLIHLAGLASVGSSFDQPQNHITTNSAMVTHLFEHVVRESWPGRAIVVSSGAVYGDVPNGGKLTEDAAVQSTSPYVVSKLLVEHQTEYYRRRGIDAIVVRPFNHIGPGQRRGFIVPDLLASLKEWQPKTRLSVGNLDSARDYTDVRDIVAAYTGLLEQPKLRYGTYNVCCGRARTGWEVLDAICRALNKGMPEVEMVGRRAIDPSVIVGNAERLKREIGWEPTIDFRTSIDEFVASV